MRRSYSALQKPRKNRIHLRFSVVTSNPFINGDLTRKKDYCSAPTPTVEQHKRILLQIASDLNFKNLDDFYQLSETELEKRGGGVLLKHYNHPYMLLSTIYPDKEWLPWKFLSVPPKYWDNVNNKRLFLDWAGKQLNVKEMSDWYKVSTKDFNDIGGASVGSPLSSLLADVYIDYEWLPWKFPAVVRGFWANEANHKKFLETAAKELKIKSLEDWYDVKQSDIVQLGGASVLSYYDGSLYQLLAAQYPEYEWLPWKFDRVPRGYWSEVANQRKFMEWAAKELKIDGYEGWYHVQNEDLLRCHGRQLLHHYSDSLFHLLWGIFPEYNWKPWLFDRLPKNVLTEDKWWREFVEYAAEKLNIKDPQDWYNVSREAMFQVVGKKPFEGWEAFTQKLVQVYALDSKKFRSLKKKQRFLKLVLSKIFGEEILEEYKHSDLVNPKTGYPLELDYYIPAQKLAFEYQGTQHFQVSTLLNDLQIRKERDLIKQDLCKKAGITLIPVPYWWDAHRDSLEATIYASRPELFAKPPRGIPIPNSPPSHWTQYYRRKKDEVSSSLLLSTRWNPDDDPTGWWMTEKFDGVRVFWDGGSLFTREGKLIKPPTFFTEALPNVPLDCELWTQYGLHQQAAALLQTKKEDKWKKAKLAVFDIDIDSKKTYEERMKVLEQTGMPNHVMKVMPTECKGTEHLWKYFEEIVKKNGEGVMLRMPNSLYERGRSDTLRKFKNFLDTEVKMIKRAEDKNAWFLQCEQLNGVTCFVQCTEHEYENPPKAGSILTVKHLGYNAYGKLLTPQFDKVRTDVSWEYLKMQNDVK